MIPTLQFLRPFIAPALIPFIGAALAFLARKYGIIYTDEQQTKIVEGAVTAILWIFAWAASISGVLKVAANKKLNRSNAATTELVQQGNAEGSMLKGQTDEFIARRAASR